MLVRVFDSMTKVVEGLGGRLALAQTAAGNELINQVRGSNRKLREKLGPIKEEDQQFKNRGILCQSSNNIARVP